MQVESFIALGDSFTEGIGDTLPDGSVRGWADFVALGLARTSQTPVRYANLAIRGKKLVPIINEQVEPALAQHPTLVSINGGGNDLMRPNVSIDSIAQQLLTTVSRITSAGSHVVLLSGANPSRHMPLGSLLRHRGNKLDEAVLTKLPMENVTYVDNWADETLEDIRYWSEDRLHLNTRGHLKVAGNVLHALEVAVPEAWSVERLASGTTELRPHRDMNYYREYVVPWVGRRLTGKSSGDGRKPKIATLSLVDLTLDKNLPAL